MTKRKAAIKAIPKKNGPGRPRREIDYALVARLAGIGCTDAEIAAALQCSAAWFCNRKKTDEPLRDAIDSGRETGRTTLRRLQWQGAASGNVTMLIWLGKQMLGQRDRREPDEGAAADRNYTITWIDPVAQGESEGEAE